MRAFAPTFTMIRTLAASMSLLGSLLASGCADAQSVPIEAGKTNGFAVVELFTSEGCSSCPPADAVLEKLASEAREKGLAIYPIAFHVNYWDRLGWKDPFATAAGTERQRTYADALRLESVYTPQMIVNGHAEFVGSDEARARREVESALKTAAATKITLRTTRGENNSVIVEYAVEHPPAGALLMIIAVADHATSAVNRGENAGRTLEHANVAVAMETKDISKTSKGQATLKLPDTPKASIIIAFVQGHTENKITGATASDLQQVQSALPSETPRK